MGVVSQGMSPSKIFGLLRPADDAPANNCTNFHHLPTLGHEADFGLFLGFVAEALGEELVHEGLFQLGGGLNDPLLRFDRPLHRRKDVRDLLLLGEWGEWDRLIERSRSPFRMYGIVEPDTTLFSVQPKNCE